MERIGTTELKAQVGRVMDLIEAGEELLLTRRGRVIGRVVPITQPRKADVFAEMDHLRSQNATATAEEIRDWIDEGRE
jgi:antitoxin (DNA-binding transcriptional repressor) of toxin-antitoxin stability system